MENVYPGNVLQDLSLSPYSLPALAPQLPTEHVLMLMDYTQPAQISKLEEGVDIHTCLFIPQH